MSEHRAAYEYEPRAAMAAFRQAAGGEYWLGATLPKGGVTTRLGPPAHVRCY
jgi:hypothetical protein